MLVHGFEAAYLFSHLLGAHEEIVIQTRTRRDTAVSVLVNEMLSDPPRFVAKSAVKTVPLGFLSAARIAIAGRNILLKPGEKFRVNLRPDVFPRTGPWRLRLVSFRIRPAVSDQIRRGVFWRPLVRSRKEQAADNRLRRAYGLSRLDRMRLLRLSPAKRSISAALERRVRGLQIPPRHCTEET